MSDKNARYIRNAVFAGCVLLTLFSALANYALIPDSDRVERRSYLEGRIYQNLPEFSLDRFIDRAYQSEFEQFAADSIPMRDDVLLASSGLQKLGVKCANVMFAFCAYPTFFGSEYLECPAVGAIVEYPSTKRVVTKDLLDSCVRAVSEAVGDHPKIRWRFALVDRSRNAVSNPAGNLVSQHADYDYYRSEFLEKLPDECPYVDLAVGDGRQYFDEYFHTDHHAQIAGALNAYERICASFGRNARADLEIERIYDGPFYGSEARSGLTTAFSDVLDDVVKPPASFRVEVDGTEQPTSWLNDGFEQGVHSYTPAERFENAYAEWFHEDAGEIHIVNAKGQGSLLIVGDSFTNNMDYLFAYSYRNVYILDPRHYDGTLRGFLKQQMVDDALLLMASNTLVNSSTLRFLTAE